MSFLRVGKPGLAWVVRITTLIAVSAVAPPASRVSAAEAAWDELAPFFQPPAELADDLGDFQSPLRRSDRSMVKSAEEWPARRKEILRTWLLRLGEWPKLLDAPAVKIVETTHRDNFTQHKVVVQVAPPPENNKHAAPLTSHGYLMVPDGKGPFPAVFVPFYEPSTSAGLSEKKHVHHDYGYQLAKRGYVTLSIGTPGGNEQGSDTRQALVKIGRDYRVQPLGFLGYVAANCHTVLAQRPEVDRERIGIVGLSYGGKWTMFASCLDDRFACAVWADPGIVFDESNGNINYYEPWYIGYDFERSLEEQRKPGRPTDQNPRTGLYKKLMDEKSQLVDFHALIAPRPVLVSGGTEDKRERWKALNHLVAVYRLLGHENRVGLTTRATHAPDQEAAAQTYRFFDVFLKAKPDGASGGRKTSQAPPHRPVAPDFISDDQESLIAAIQKGVVLLRKGAENYPRHRDCFSCHHQTLPLLAMTLSKPVRDRAGRPAVPFDEPLAGSIGKFSQAAFAGKHESLREGKGIGGRALTVGYGLWTLDLAEWKRDETTDAMAAYLLKTQEEDGSWKFHSLRPPASSSIAMTTAVAVYGLKAYGLDSDAAGTAAALARAKGWFRRLERCESHEDVIGALWGRYLLQDEDDNVTSGSVPATAGEGNPYETLKKTQRSDGGWAQVDRMESDAYATGQALVLLAQTHSGDTRPVHQTEDFRRGIRYLLNTQQPDGSWHVRTRAKPVQAYFDNGDPHGKDQFISMMATSWAAAALAVQAGNNTEPLESPTLSKRRKR